jgi:hypothetical protein
MTQAHRNFCDICNLEWDPQVADHKRGVDCAAGLSAALAGVRTEVKKLLKHVQDLENSYTEEKVHTVDAFRVVTERHQALLDRFEVLARRVNVLEHPELKKVPSIKAALHDDKAAKGK